MIDSACGLLKMLGAFDEKGDVTSLGRRMSSYPLHPRLARMVEEGRNLGCESQALLAAALIAEGMLIKKGVTQSGKGESDIGLQCELFCKLEDDPHSLSAVLPSWSAAHLNELSGLYSYSAGAAV